MRTGLAIAALLLGSCATSATKSGEWEVEAKLAEIPSGAPDCGHLQVVVVMRYEGPKGDLFVAHACPELTRKAYGGEERGDLEVFRAGDRHRLRLRPAADEDVFLDVYPKGP